MNYLFPPRSLVHAALKKSLAVTEVIFGKTAKLIKAECIDNTRCSATSRNITLNLKIRFNSQSLMHPVSSVVHLSRVPPKRPWRIVGGTATLLGVGYKFKVFRFSKKGAGNGRSGRKVSGIIAVPADPTDKGLRFVGTDAGHRQKIVKNAQVILPR